MHPPAGFPLPISIDEKTFFTPESYVPQSKMYVRRQVAHAWISILFTLFLFLFLFLFLMLVMVGDS